MKSKKKAWRRRLRANRVLPVALYACARTLEATLRFRWHLGAFEAGAPQGIYCVWHNRLLTTLQAYHQLSKRRPDWSPRPLAVLVSASKDGSLVSSFVKRYGCVPIRGSSSRRGAQAMVEARSLIREGYNIALTPDGPRGPKYSVNPGAIQLAQSFDLPLAPVIVNTTSRWEARSWDAFQAPRPGARIEFSMGEPVVLPKDLDMDAACDRVRTAMMALTKD